MSFALPNLPYGHKDLEPHISEQTIDFHYGKHHRTYLDNLNKLSEGTEFSKMNLEQVVLSSYKAKNMPIFNNAAQVLNHNFYWNSIKPNGGGMPNGKLLEKIKKDFGSYEKFKDDFKNAAITQFASGWAWLAYDPKAKKLAIVKTGNADNPILNEMIPLITIDVWEHAYYLDYQNKRLSYVESFISSLVNWDFAEKNYLAATK